MSKSASGTRWKSESSQPMSTWGLKRTSEGSAFNAANDAKPTLRCMNVHLGKGINLTA
jgi:hypothetical protein